MLSNQLQTNSNMLKAFFEKLKSSPPSPTPSDLDLQLLHSLRYNLHRHLQVDSEDPEDWRVDIQTTQRTGDQIGLYNWDYTGPSMDLWNNGTDLPRDYRLRGEIRLRTTETSGPGIIWVPRHKLKYPSIFGSNNIFNNHNIFGRPGADFHLISNLTSNLINISI